MFYLISLDLFNLSVTVVLAALGPDEQYANYAGQSRYLYGSLFLRFDIPTVRNLYYSFSKHCIR